MAEGCHQFCQQPAVLLQVWSSCISLRSKDLRNLSFISKIPAALATRLRQTIERDDCVRCRTSDQLARSARADFRILADEQYHVDSRLEIQRRAFIDTFSRGEIVH